MPYKLMSNLVPQFLFWEVMTFLRRSSTVFTDVVLHYAVRPRGQGRDPRLAHLQTLQNVLQQMILEVTAQFKLQFSRYAEATEVSDQSCCRRRLLIGNGLHFRPLRKYV
jgi:hypothetical protein